MRLQPLITCLLMLACAPLSCPAQSVEDIEQWEQKRQGELAALPRTVRAYADSIGCAVAFEPRNVVRWRGQPEGVHYLALIAIDSGCAGGSRSWGSIFIAIHEGAYGKLYVLPAYSHSGVISGRFPQAIDSIISNNGEVRFSGRVAQGNDPGNRPSRQTGGTVIWSGIEWAPR